MTESSKTKNKSGKIASEKAIDQSNQIGKSKGLRIAFAVLIALLIAVFLFAGLAYAYQAVYAGKFYPGTKVAGIEVAGKTPAQVKSLLETELANVDNKEVEIEAGTETVATTLGDLDLHVDIDETVDELYSNGRDGNFLDNISSQLKTLYQGKDFDYVLSSSEDKTADLLEELIPNSYEESKNATIVVRDDEVTVEPEQEGKQIDLEKLKHDIATNLDSGSDIAVTISLVDIAPEITSEQVMGLLPEVEAIVSEEITFSNSEVDKTLTASSEDIAGWLVLKLNDDSEVSIEISEDALKQYISENLGANINQNAIDKKINADTKAVISKGQDGYTLDETQVLEAITGIIDSRITGNETTNEVALVVTVQERGEKEVQTKTTTGGTPGLAEGQYIEVDISSQMMYLFVGEEQNGAYRVSTGKWDMPTPLGTRTVGGKSVRAYSAKYDLYMPYWMSLGGGYGIHELPEWADGTKEGESHLGTPVSHGCIRLGVGAAAAVYNWTPSGTPVFIHQ